MYAPRRSLSRAPSPIPPTYAAPQASAPYPPADAMASQPYQQPNQQPHYPIRRPASSADFRVENVARSPSAMGSRHPSPSNSSTGANQATYFDENTYRQRVAAFISAKDRQFATTGHIFADPAELVLFFRSKSGISQSLDFPIDVEYNSPPALDVLVSACRPHQTSDYNGYLERESLFYPPTLPLTTSLELANHPVLDAVKNSLFPNLPHGHYLTAVRDRLEVVLDGGRLERQVCLGGAHARTAGEAQGLGKRAATLILTLPVRFTGGALIIRDPTTGATERFPTKSRGENDLEWVAFSGHCEYETEVVEKGYKLLLSYAVHVRNFSTEGAIRFDSLSIPTDNFFEVLAPIMNVSRGRKIGVYLTNDYAVNPSLVTAQSLATQLKGGDYLLYNAFKMYKLNVDLHWAAGEYIWPSEGLVEVYGDDIESSSSSIRAHSGAPTINANPWMPQTPFGGVGPMPRPPNSAAGGVGVGLGVGMAIGMGGMNSAPPAFPGFPTPPHQAQHPFGAIGVSEQAPLRARVEESGGKLFADAGVTVLTNDSVGVPVPGSGFGARPASATPPTVTQGAVERVPFVAHGELKKFVVNVMMVVYVP
ncbi:hypothetical protein FA15DRAFT_652930 [Coprinopsis marcescibilis]|uniref:Uncharacterized protein n=1 Tax=Coprinopsis marcescibilis TaxID=230819 RepID=A0A5C3LI98_COPMA|nr:hypothetical protein FA15DRAFT_652930 [Coprinopsis marcescibilis]